MVCGVRAARGRSKVTIVPPAPSAKASSQASAQSLGEALLSCECWRDRLSRSGDSPRKATRSAVKLVLAGARVAAATSRNAVLPSDIESIHLFQAPPLIEQLTACGVKIGSPR